MTKLWKSALLGCALTSMLMVGASAADTEDVTTAEGLKDAITAAGTTDAATITLGGNFDILEAMITIPTNAEITLDLNGYTITAGNAGNDNIDMSPHSKLTIKDSGRNGEIASTTGSNNGVINIDAADFILESGTISTENTGINVYDNVSSTTVYNQTSTVTIKGGSVESTYRAIQNSNNLGGNTEITVEDGYVSSIYSTWVGTPVITDGGTVQSGYHNVTVTGGEVDSIKLGTSSWAYCGGKNPSTSSNILDTAVIAPALHVEDDADVGTITVFTYDTAAALEGYGLDINDLFDFSECDDDILLTYHNALSADDAFYDPSWNTENDTYYIVDDGEAYLAVTVIFDANGGSASEEEYTVAYGGTLDELPTASYSGYSFNGWYVDGTYVTTDTIFTEDTTVVADWSKSVRNESSSSAAASDDDDDDDEDEEEADEEEVAEEVVEEVVEDDTTVAALPFADLDTDDETYEAVAVLYELGVINGMTDDTFEKDVDISRGMITTMLHRLESTPESFVDGSFGDIAEGTWYADGVNWASANGIVNGYTDGSFGAENPITNQEMCVILMQYAEYLGCEIEVTSVEGVADLADWAQTAVAWAAENGIMTVDADGNLDATSVTTRGEACVMITALMELMTAE